MRNPSIMKHRLSRILVLAGLVLLSAFTLYPPVHTVPERHAFTAVPSADLPAAGSITLLAGSGTVRKGEQICVPIKARQFEDILSMQFSINWDAEMLSFKKLSSFSLEGLSERNFGMHLLDKGVLTFSWYDPKLLGVNQPDDALLYELCFEATGEAGHETKIEFTSKPTLVEVTNAASEFLDFKSETGIISIEE